MPRNALLDGLALESDRGVNPYRFGFVGSTDTHNSNPGDTAEERYPGLFGVLDDSPQKRGDYDFSAAIPKYGPGGLAGLWAPRNDRKSLFEALKNRHAFATSGTRLTVLMAAGMSLSMDWLAAPRDVWKHPDVVPMGGTLRAEAGDGKPTLLVWAIKDPDGMGLDRIELVKGWLDPEGRPQEKVIDLACSGQRMPDPETGRCRSLPPAPDGQSCDARRVGDSEINIAWTDRDYEDGQNAFYYVRVLEAPSCRWNAYELPAETATRDQRPKLIQERAWSSPVWVSPSR